MLRLVLDTNVWLDWLVFDDPGVAGLRVAVDSGRAQVYIDAACLAELERVLAYPLRGERLAGDALSACLARVTQIARSPDRAAVPPDYPLPACADADDQKFLELARDCGADALVTKDRALLDLSRRKRTPLPFRIVTPAALDL